MTDMAARRVPRRRLVVSVLALALALPLAVAMIPTGEGALRSSFEVALKQAPVATRTVGQTNAQAVPISGSEDYWLSSAGDRGVPVFKTVAIGDDIAFHAGGQKRTYRVKSLANYTPDSTAVDVGPGDTRLVLVTAYDKQTPADRVVRFLIEVDAGTQPNLTGITGRTL